MSISTMNTFHPFFLPFLILTLFLSLSHLWMSSSTTIFANAQQAYREHEKVSVQVNVVGPFSNPAEIYKYYSLPFCRPKEELIQGDDSNLNEALAGDRRRTSMYDIRFKTNVEWQSLCSKKLSEEDVQKFISAIKQHYIFEMFVDDLSIKGFIGEVETYKTRAEGTKGKEKHEHTDNHYYLFTHLDFSIARNNQGNVIAVNLTTDPSARVELEYGKEVSVEFSYSVRWTEIDYPVEDRLKIHSRQATDSSSIEIHWLSIINSFVLVLLLTAFLAVILIRVLHKDFARYLDDQTASEEDLLVDQEEQEGWKSIHSDVFRFPNHLMLFCAAIGNGTQLFVLTTILLGLALLDAFEPEKNRGAIYVAAVMFYVLTSFVNGYTSTKLYLQMQGDKWALQSLLTCGLFTLPCFLTFCVVNSIAWYYGSSTALPASIAAFVICMWALISIPSTIFGSLRAKNSGPHNYDAPCKTNRVQREIPPPSHWYRSMPFQLVVAGFLPFSAIYIELHYIYLSIYGHSVYTMFGLLAVAFVMLVIVTSFITIALTYIQLCAEDWKWNWRAFLSAATTGLFVQFYAIFYYFARSQMSGTLQGAFFFGYNLLISLGFSLMLGTVGWFSAQLFVKHIYKQIKID